MSFAAIADLVAKSLVSVNAKGQTPIYRLLDTTRAYAIEKLVEQWRVHLHRTPTCRTLSRHAGPRRRRCRGDRARRVAHDLWMARRQSAQGAGLGLLVERRRHAGCCPHRGCAAAVDAPVADERMPHAGRAVAAGADLQRAT